MTVPEIRYGNHTYFFLCLGQSLDDVREKPEQAEDRLLLMTADWKALAFLRRVAAWDSGLYKLRQVAIRAGVDHPGQYQEADLLDIIAALIAADRVAVYDRYMPGGSGTPPEEPKAAPARAAASSQQTVAEKDEDPPTFTCDVYEDQQAAGLIAAAQYGIPFCEECCKGVGR